MALSIPYLWFDLLVGFSFYAWIRFGWGPPFFCSASTTLWNVDTDSSMLLSSLWDLTVLLLSSTRILLLSWVMSLSINVISTRKFRRLATSWNKVAKLADNELGSTGSQYPSTPFQSGKGMSSSSSAPYDRMDAYKASIFYGFMASPPPVGNTTLPFLLLSFSSPTVSTVLPSSVILDGDLPATQFWPGIWRWRITVFFSSTLLFLLLMSFMLSCFTWIGNGNETGIPSDFLGYSLALCGTIISSLNFYSRSPLT